VEGGLKNWNEETEGRGMLDWGGGRERGIAIGTFGYLLGRECKVWVGDHKEAEKGRGRKRGRRKSVGKGEVTSWGKEGGFRGLQNKGGKRCGV